MLDDQDKAKYRAALVHHRSGRLDAAGLIYDELLAKTTPDAELLHIKGLLLHQLGNHGEAIGWLDRAASMAPSNATYQSSRGMTLAALKRWNEAIAAFRQTLYLEPEFPGARFNLGVALQHRGRLDEAMDNYRAALKQAPDPDPANNLGLALRQTGRLAEAIASFRQALAYNPKHVDAAINLAAALKEVGDADQALAHYLDLLEFHPNRAEVHFQIGLIHQAAGRIAEAEKQFALAVGAKGHPESANNLALLLEARGQIQEAEILYRQAIRERPDFPDAANNLGNLLQFSGRLEEAMSCYHHALRSRLNDPGIRYNRALALLALGRWKEGWHEYRWRWKWDGFGTPTPSFHQPWWKGEDLQGRTILLWSEQGLGDTIHFVRYVALVKARGARVILAVPKELRSLVETCSGIDVLLGDNQPLPPFDFHAPLLDLPAIFETTPEDVPSMVPYIKIPPPDLVSIPIAPRGQLKVGLIWAGGTKYPKDHLRSLRLEQLHGLLNTPSVVFYSLQVGPKRSELKDLPPSARVYDIGGKLKDFRETASVMCQMDLILSTCTSSLHLAGALARPTWAMLSFAPCWRWLHQGDSTPWYPGMRLFRQKALNDWDSVIGSVRGALQEHVQKNCW